METLESSAIMSKHKKDLNARWAVYDSNDASRVWRDDFKSLKRAMIYANRVREHKFKVSVGKYEDGMMEQYQTLWGLSQ